MAIINSLNVKGTLYDVGLNSNSIDGGLILKDKKLTIDTAYGLDIYNDSYSGGTGIGVMASDGIVVNGAGVSVKAGSGITVNSNGVSVKA